MTKIDIISGFLGAGKTTFIKKQGSRWCSLKMNLERLELTEVF